MVFINTKLKENFDVNIFYPKWVAKKMKLSWIKIYYLNRIKIMIMQFDQLKKTRITQININIIKTVL